MDSIDLNFLKEYEVEVIVNVIEKDFELKAAEKSRLCRLRKKLITNDQRAVELSQSTLEGLCCVICFDRFVFFINPKKLCCSCSLTICRSCCKYIKLFDDYVCMICQQQKDLIAMNCTWFYENIRRKFMEGGSQIVANSLSEYPRKNLISPAILNMVKGTQITKFRFQIEEATRTIEESLIKVELSFTDRETKSMKYTELIQKFVEKLKQILRNTSQVLYITMENYLNKIGKKNTNIDVEVLNTLHEEVELLIGRKIDIRMCQRKLLKGQKTLDNLDSQDNLETRLSSPIVDKLLYDVQQSLTETRGKHYEDLNYTLQSMVKKNKYDSMDFDFESVSQAPSRQGTIRQSFRLTDSQPPPLLESPPSESEGSLYSSGIYEQSKVGEKSSIVVSKEWNKLLTNNPPDLLKSLSATVPDTLDSIVNSIVDNDNEPVDSDAISMHPLNQSHESNWLMKARFPIGSLKSLFVESNDHYNKKKDKKESMTTRSEIIGRNRNIDDEMEEMYDDNLSVLSDRNNSDLEQEYLQNLAVVDPVPSQDKESIESQDSGIVKKVKLRNITKPLVPVRKSRISQFPVNLPVAPPVPKRKSYTAKSPYHGSSSDSTVDGNSRSTSMIVVKSKKNKVFKSTK